MTISIAFSKNFVFLHQAFHSYHSCLGIAPSLNFQKSPHLLAQDKNRLMIHTENPENR